ncbi:S41 family peptidase [Zhouia sp. PK063]|uniref:S41 family peptidase n=1 Tax=Zhouia sp. PK063 TaxID=3373602 RepID=UPI0037B9C86F
MKKYFLSLKQLAILAFCGIVLSSCSKNDDNGGDDSENVTLNNEVNDFIWRGLNEVYLWQGEVANLADTKDDDKNEYYKFLNSYDTPENLFESLLYQRGTIDKFSFLTDDYVELENSFAGVSKSNGLEFYLGRIGSSDDVFGVVKYVVNGSNAATKDIARGDFFLSVDGTQLTVDNYSDLLFGDNDSYTLGMADVTDGTIASNGKTVDLTKTELIEDPILMHKVIEQDGHKIGYLVYNGFVANFDKELNNVFADFKSQGVTDLVLDLRYNPGGSVQSSIYLSSMITGQFTGEIYSTEVWNDRYQAYFEANSPESLNNRFLDKMSDETTINKLNLSKVYILTTNGTASASELVLNCLKPYIDVVQIGETTVGKYTASITLYDSDNFGRDGANPDHTYAIQPLVLKSANANGVTDYYDGITPDIAIDEDITEFKPLGDTSEPYLAAAIQSITGTSTKTAARMQPALNYIPEKISNSANFKPLKDNMYIDIKNQELPSIK